MTKVIYNSEVKDNIVSNLNDCVDKLKEVNNTFYNTLTPSDFYYKRTLLDIQKKLNIVEEDLKKYKENINKFTNNIESNELELLVKINNIEELIIEKF